MTDLILSLKDHEIDNPQSHYKYESKTGAHQDAEDLVLEGYLNLCACGQSEVTLEYIGTRLTYLKEKDDRHSRNRELGIKSDYDHERTLASEVFTSEGEEQFFMHWADSIGLLDHGGSIGGAWMTEKGRQVVSLIHEIQGKK